ncbi:heme/hemin ABC transporter substrate-binding protein [Taibaiella chishuiensis]|uniref:Iron complex transport system substrate-binding protein n=1 Tax=Taibaiella chishuiensis TaxID=1434707 RepID=A0A2P8DAJ6_9BACT|nr:helical backbone metal receptor [Taibaiella chishuiensis]PSK94233.1 iron complex transport system substrate-binding protein [Taibaiella chishuiensis]
MLRKLTYSFLALCLSVTFFACSNNNNKETAADGAKDAAASGDLRIVSLSGPVSEALASLGLEQNIVGVDVTSTYPESLNKVTKVGNTHNLNIEAILALKPTYVISMKERGINPEQATQLQQAGVKVWVIEQEYSIEGTKKYIGMLADSFGKKEAGQKLAAEIDSSFQTLPKYDTKPSILFIYARGAGALSVCGRDMPMSKMIDLAGGTNAAADIEGFKPVTAEALIKQNPDGILLFTSGLASVDGPEGMLKVPGVAATKAGKNKNFIVMDGELLAGFGPRVVLAIKELGEKIHKAQ